ncbi:HAT family dimerization domain protein, partial [Pyrenophora tritici-repentis]
KFRAVTCFTCLLESLVIFDQRMSSDEWAILQELLAILDPIKACTKKLEGRPSEESATGIADVYDVLSLILGQLEKLKVEYAESQKDSAF